MLLKKINVALEQEQIKQSIEFRVKYGQVLKAPLTQILH